MRAYRSAPKSKPKEIWEYVYSLAESDSNTRNIYGVRIASDLDECQALWQAVIPGEHITDLWEVRSCFQQQYKQMFHWNSL